MGNKLQRVLEEHGYTKIRRVGSGAFGEAILVKSKENGESYILKMMKIISKQQAELAVQEICVLKSMNHPFIVGYKGYFTADDKLFVVMEYCERGDLDKAIQLQHLKGFYFSEKEILDWFVQICLALKHVHNKNIIHRDIKPQNVFVTMEGTLKLGDFGLCRLLPGLKAYAESSAGTPFYMAPEMWAGKPYNTSSDVWSLGLVLHNLCTLQYREEDLHAAHKGVLHLSRYSNDLQGLFQKLLTVNPEKRPDVNDVLLHPIVARRIPKHVQFEVLRREFDRGLLQAMGLDGKDSFLKDEALLEEIVSELRENVSILCHFFDGDHQHLQGQIRNLNEITNKLEDMHRKTTIGSLSGGVIGAAGGITSLVGLVLAPFTLGASLAVTAVGVGMAAAGGATGAASNITNMVKQKNLRKTIESILDDFKQRVTPVLVSVNKINLRVAKMQEYHKVAKSVHKFEGGMSLGRGAAGLFQVIRIAKAVDISRVLTQATRAVSVAGKMTAVLTSLMLVLDMVFIAKDAKEVHELNKMKKTAKKEAGHKMSEEKAKEIKSTMLKFINEMRSTESHFKNILQELQKTKEIVASEIVPRLS